MTTVYLDTRIPELNALLTRDITHGIAVSDGVTQRSSIMLVKGKAGVGKSVLCGLVAHNIHLTTVNGKKCRIACVYFSLGQEAQALEATVQDIIGTEGIQTPLYLSPEVDPGAYSLKENKVTPDAGGKPIQPFGRDTVEMLGEMINGFSLSQENQLKNTSTFLTYIEGKAKSYLNVHAKSGKYGEFNDPLIALPVFFIDPINLLFHHNDRARMTIEALLASFSKFGIPTVLVLEDPVEAPEWHRELAMNLEYAADQVIELTSRNDGHRRTYIEVTKCRYGQPIFGPQLYRIEGKNHSLSNVPSQWESNHPGILIFRSIHWYLSKSRGRIDGIIPKYSGMSQLDCMLHSDQQPGAYLPSDSFILLRGNKGGHKFSLALNLLVAGLWDDKPSNVLLVSLGEETSMGLESVALACPQSVPRYDNGTMIKRIAKINQDIPNSYQEVGQKTSITYWKIAGTEYDEASPKLIEVSFKPGHLACEEFLWVVDSLITEFKISRVLIDNTAHLKLRFPVLRDERMLFPAISSLTHEKNVMLIVNDVLGDASDRDLSFGLATCADYILTCEVLKRQKEERRGDEAVPAVVDISNVRGKLYRQRQLGIDVVRCSECRVECDRKSNTFVANLNGLCLKPIGKEHHSSTPL